MAASKLPEIDFVRRMPLSYDPDTGMFSWRETASATIS